VEGKAAHQSIPEEEKFLTHPSIHQEEKFLIHPSIRPSERCPLKQMPNKQTRFVSVINQEKPDLLFLFYFIIFDWKLKKIKSI
jgi:hypothetical protein